MSVRLGILVMPAKKVLITIENRFSARYVVDTLLHEKWQPGTEFKILHVLEPPPHRDLPQSYWDNRKRMRKGAEFLLNDVAAQINAATEEITTSIEVREGRAKDQILSFAHKWRPDLIVMGTHDHRGLNGFLIGSVARAIATHAPCSIMVIKDKPRTNSEQMAHVLESSKG